MSEKPDAKRQRFTEYDDYSVESETSDEEEPQDYVEDVRQAGCFCRQVIVGMRK